jgi:hypothetical protein
MGIPVTTAARTLLDLSDILEKQALRRVVTEAEYLNWREAGLVVETDGLCRSQHA